MIKKIFAFLSILIIFCSKAERYRGSSFHKLSNGTSVVLVDTEKSDSLLVILCISSGSSNEIDKFGVANLLNYILAKKLKAATELDALQYGSESNSYTGHDQSVYYLYGKLENLEGFLKNLSKILSSSGITEEDADDAKQVMKRRAEEEEQKDRSVIKSEARRSVYWHSNYGNSVMGTLDAIESALKTDIENYKNRNYTPKNTTLVIVGNIDKNLAMENVSKYFGQEVQFPSNTSAVSRVQEPPHHDSVTKITKYSSQVNCLVVDIYWRIPNYRSQGKAALSAEIFINYLLEELRERLVDEQKVVVSMSSSYSLWNYDGGDLCLTVTFRKSDDIEECIAAVLSEIQYLVSEKISAKDAEKFSKKISDASNVFYMDTEFSTWSNWVIPKIGSGNDLDFLKSYSSWSKKYNLDEINAQGRAIFKNGPCVISITKPTENSYEHNVHTISS
ncbi:MAG: insulinase family protein [Holosporaceae bacterium]|jgi:zinc protease|nr:insulinase family protein [Holosporaceae bacterium]